MVKCWKPNNPKMQYKCSFWATSLISLWIAIFSGYSRHLLLSNCAIITPPSSMNLWVVIMPQAQVTLSVPGDWFCDTVYNLSHNYAWTTYWWLAILFSIQRRLNSCVMLEYVYSEINYGSSSFNFFYLKPHYKNSNLHLNLSTIVSTWNHSSFKQMTSSQNSVTVAWLIVLVRKDPGTTSPFSSPLDPFQRKAKVSFSTFCTLSLKSTLSQ